MLTHSEAIWLAILTLVGIVLSPITAVLITLWYQRHTEHRKTKVNTLLTLLANRAIQPAPPAYIGALNTIDVIFYDNPSVVKLWHEYYELLSQSLTDNSYSLWESKKLDLLFEIAKVLGYKKLRQTDISRTYSPKSHVDNTQRSGEILDELLRVLKDTKSLKIETNPNPSPQIEKN